MSENGNLYEINVNNGEYLCILNIGFQSTFTINHLEDFLVVVDDKLFFQFYKKA